MQLRDTRKGQDGVKYHIGSYTEKISKLGHQELLTSTKKTLEFRVILGSGASICSMYYVS